MSNVKPEELRTLLNAQTAKISWLELQKYFAQGVTYYVQGDEDLVEIAASCIENNTVEIERLLNMGLLCKVSTEQALYWYQHQSLLWAVVATPWVLVQEL